MSETITYSIFPLGDAALTLDFGKTESKKNQLAMMQLMARLRQAETSFIRDIYPAQNALTVLYDVVNVKRNFPKQTAFDTMALLIEEISAGPVENRTEPVKNIPIQIEDSIAVNEHLLSLYIPGHYLVYNRNGATLITSIMALHINDDDIGTIMIRDQVLEIVQHEKNGHQKIQFGRIPFSSLYGEQAEVIAAGDTISFHLINEDEFAHY